MSVRTGRLDGMVIALALLLGACARTPTPAEVRQAYDAATKGDGAAMRTALSHGIDPNYYYWDGGYLIDRAAMAPKTDALVVLIKRGARVNVQNPDDGSTPLITAVSTNHCEAARLLLLAGAGKDMKVLHAGALGSPDVDGLTAPEIYRKSRIEYPDAYGTKCWSEVGRMLLNTQ